MKKSIVLATAVAAILSSAALTSGVAMADASVNATATSNYIWRGVSQSSDTASVQGGVDWSGESGVYAGTWVGSLVVGQETDFYVGFAGEAGDFGYDVGAIVYAYTLAPNTNFTEVYLNASFGGLSAGVATTVDSASANTGGAFDEGDLYLNAAYDFTAGPFDTSVFVGTYMFDNDSATQALDYTHYGVSLTSGEVTVSVEKNDIEGGNADNVRIVATWSKAWDI